MEGWIADLGIKYKNIERDFSDGYLLGSILYMVNIQDDFGTFSKHPNAAKTNLSKVQLSLEKIGIKLNIPRVISQEPGYIIKILTQVHKGLHTISYSNLRSVRGKSAVSMARATKFDLIEKPLKRFDEIRVQQSEKALHDEKKQLETIRQGYLGERKKQIDILKSNKIFMQQWDLEGKKNWSQNQMRKTQRVKHEENVLAKITSDKTHRVSEYRSDHCEQVVDGIKEFERNMIRLGIDHVPDQKEVKKKKIDIQTEALVTMAKIVERKNINMEATKEREVRQRKLLVEQMKNEKFDSYKKGSSRLWKVLVGVFGKIYSIGFGETRKYSQKLKSFRESLKKTEDLFRKTEVKWGKIESDRQKNIKQEEDIKKKNLPSEKERIKKNILQSMKSTKDKHTKLCSPILDLIIELSNEGTNFLSTHSKIPEKLWESWLTLFKSNNPPSFKSITQLSSGPDNIQDQIDLAFSSTPVFSLELVLDYLNTTGPWCYNPCQNNSLLGDILETVLPIAYPDDPDPPMPEGPYYLPLKLLLLGPTFSGKKTQAKRLQELYGLKLIEVPKILEEAKKVMQRRAEPEDNKKKKVVEEEPEVFVQTCVETLGEDELGRSKLIRARLRAMFGDVERRAEEEVKKAGKKEEVKCMGYVLMSYPTTIQEATDLERHMSSFIHPSELPVSQAMVKKAEALVMARPSQKPPAEKKLFRTAWDLVVYLDVDLPVCVARAVDRRVDPAGNVYNLSYNPPPDNLLAKCKPIEHPNQHEVQEAYEEIARNRDTLIHWFSQFGSNHVSSLVVVKAQQGVDAVTECIKHKVAEVLRAKNNTDIAPAALYGEHFAIKYEHAKVLAADWEKIREGYLQGLSYFLSYVCMHKDSYLDSLQQVKNQFFDFLQGSDEKSEIFDEFSSEFIRRIQSKSVFSSEEISKINQELDDLADRIWDIVMSRKDSAILRRQEIMESSALSLQIAGILHIVMNLLQIEINKYYKVVDLVDKYYHFVENRTYLKREVPLLGINWKEWSGGKIGYQLLNYLMRGAKDAVIHDAGGNTETRIFLTRIGNIEEFATRSIEDYTELTRNLHMKMDLWISKAVELENSAMVRMVKYI